MSGENWTPGPWHWRETHPLNACANVMATNEDGWDVDIATLYGSTDDVPAPSMPDEPWGDHPIRRANAHLIAAAPTLYETAAETSPELRRLAAEMNLGPDDEGRDWYEMLIACADDLDMAMAKARGEA
jgi:hypothetical protein